MSVNRDPLRRIGWRLLARPLVWIAGILGRHVNPWQRRACSLPANYFGLEDGDSLKKYFAPPSAVPLGTLDDLCTFLLSCQYCPVGEGLGQQDRWMRPHDVEWSRAGDCKALALWAWRRLVELGYDAELVCGEWAPPGGAPALHAFVVFRDGSTEHLIETTARSKPAMVRPLAVARAEYTPAYSVDAALRTYMYDGSLRLKPPHSRRAA